MYAQQEPGMQYWAVDVVSKDDWLLMFMLPNPGEKYPGFSVNITMYRGMVVARHIPGMERNSNQKVWQISPNRVLEKYFNVRRGRWDLDYPKLPWD